MNHNGLHVNVNLYNRNKTWIATVNIKNQSRSIVEVNAIHRIGIPVPWLRILLIVAHYFAFNFSRLFVVVNSITEFDITFSFAEQHSDDLIWNWKKVPFSEKYLKITSKYHLNNFDYIKRPRSHQIATALAYVHIKTIP